MPVDIRPFLFVAEKETLVRGQTFEGAVSTVLEYFSSLQEITEKKFWFKPPVQHPIHNGHRLLQTSVGDIGFSTNFAQITLPSDDPKVKQVVMLHDPMSVYAESRRPDSLSTNIIRGVFRLAISHNQVSLDEIFRKGPELEGKLPTVESILAAAQTANRNANSIATIDKAFEQLGFLPGSGFWAEPGQGDWRAAEFKTSLGKLIVDDKTSHLFKPSARKIVLHDAEMPGTIHSNTVTGMYLEAYNASQLPALNMTRLTSEIALAQN